MQHAWEWQQPPQPLMQGQVHVWMAHLEQPPAVMAHLSELLSDEERQKAARFRFARDRACYCVAHAFLRHIISAQLGMEPQALPLAAASHGKPYLTCQHGQLDLRFNLSHSGGCALLALALNREVGIDIEFARPLDDADLIATSFFSLAEREALSALPTSQKQDAFYRCWSRKEAVIKVLGLGLSMPLSDFDVSLAPGIPARLIDIRGDVAPSGAWTLHDLPLVPGYANALAVEGEIEQIWCWRWRVPASER